MFPMFVYGDIVFNEEDLEKNSRNPEFLLINMEKIWFIR